MEYTMALTRRHTYPKNAKGTIYPSSNEDCARRVAEQPSKHRSRLDAWADFTIPADCTKLRVYMSGYRKLHESLYRVCSARGIAVVELWPKKGLKKEIKKGRVDIGVAMNPTSYEEVFRK